MTIASILASKSNGKNTISVQAGTTISEVTQILYQNNIGAVLVMRGKELIGFLSDRGITRAMAQNPGGVRAMPAEAAMRPRQFETTPSASIESAMRLMTDNKVRYLPVFEDDVLVGIVSVGDVVKALLDRQTAAVEHMTAYIGQS